MKEEQGEPMEDKKPAAKTDSSEGTPVREQDRKRAKTDTAFPIIPMFSAQQEDNAIRQRSEDIPLRVSQIMPHARVLVGKKGKSTLEAMIDTGAGLNLGRLHYHENISKQHPDIVHKFQWIKDMQALEEFNIGGVDAKSTGELAVKAVISYYTPYTVDGQTVTIAFGLAASAAANTIIGLPFLRSTKTTVYLDDETSSTVVLQLLGVSLPIAYHPPLMADMAPSSGTKEGAAYTATTAKQPPHRPQKAKVKNNDDNSSHQPTAKESHENPMNMYHTWVQQAQID